MGLSRRRITGLLGLLLALGAAGGCDHSDRPMRVFLITIDTLRPDHLSMYGYANDTDAPLRWLADEGVRFTNAYSTAPWTAPALASLLTSVHPHTHGVRGGTVPGFHAGRQRVHQQQTLPESLATLAERLDAAGFATFAVSASPHTRAELGFAQGFDTFAALLPEAPEPERGRVYADADAISRTLHGLAPRIRAAGRAFVWVHWLDPHHPYIGRAPWLETFQQNARADASSTAPPSIALRPAPRATPTRAPAARAALTPLYDSEIRYATERLAAWLADLHVTDDDLVILTSDHGEAFYEHGYWGHSTWMYETELRVPLLVRFPRRLELRGDVGVPVSLLDILPTILDVAGLPVPEAGIEGRSLVAVARGDATADARPIYAEHWRHGNRLRAVRRGRYKLIADYERETEQLFDLESDPSEEHDLVDSPEPEVRRAHEALHGLLELHRIAAESATPAAARAPDPNVERALRELGYIE